ncbi:DJ-1/YajL/PfpI superfamily, includes chaperone protein YajL (former ThiJ), parkinsonism-associated protein DJ-1, peptidases PfpI, Hsp31 [hydrothermal vent metagenome]|uniref:DJ-1/YajL/PfpI superfamily, includes chaperone protein YajL (Former ThiJ), parkinsonism-associated protein DJ-1, peptidases PfpI, Hsp31 n=1 Tax=hydrothermal vent metagenome TaxID=652676 RepID=A0A3B0ZLR3_9ZZZZ
MASPVESKQKQLKVLVPLAQGCEELEAVTITDLLTRAGITVVTASLDEKPVQASRGMVLIADTVIDNVMDEIFDAIVLPGGLPGADHLQNDKRVQTKLKSMAADNKIIAAICAAPKALAAAGLLDGKAMTSYPGALEQCKIQNMNYKEQSVVVDGNIITSRGPGTAMDFALSLIEKLLGKEKRSEVELPLMRV